MESSILLKNLRDGKEEGLVAAYRLYRQSLLYFVIRYVDNREEAEDIVADVFVKAWNRRNEFQHIDGLRAFLYVSAKNASLNYLRKSPSLSLSDAAENFEELLQEDADIFLNITRTELVKSILDEVEKLPQKQQDVFKYTFLEDFTIEEISQKMHISATAVYANRSRALATLRALLAGKGIVASLSLLYFLFFSR